MIDTITLFLDTNQFKITNYEAFTPSAKGFYEKPYYEMTKGYFQCVQNGTAEDKRNGIYSPQLTLNKQARKGGISIGLKIQFSAPKMLFGNNFDELDTSDKNLVLKALQARLKDMGVLVDDSILTSAQVVCIHYGKNIILNAGTVSLITRTILKMDISKRLDSSKTDFRNEGHAIRFHTNDYEMTFYDKIKDLQQSKISEKRAFEEDSFLQQDLFTKEQQANLEVLRMEVRLNSKKKIREFLTKNGCNPQATTFEALFNKEFARRVLMNFWDQHILPSIPIVILSEENKEVIYHSLLFKGFSHQKALALVGTLSIIQETGIRTYKEIDATFYRFKKQIESIDLTENFLYSVFKNIKETINQMDSVKLTDQKGK